MSLMNTFVLDLDLKDNNYISEPQVTSNDAIRFIVNVFDDGFPYDLTNASTFSLSSTRPDGIVVLKSGTKIGTNQITFDIGSTETSITGRVNSKVQVYDVDGRVSTISFSYIVDRDPSGEDYIPSINEKTLIEEVLGNGPVIISEAEDAVIAIQSAIDTVSGIQATEDLRVTSETTRNNNETARVTAESTRAANETARVTAEGLRVTAETTRNTNETTRKNAETARVTAESTRAANETSRGTAETARTTAETTRVANETARNTAETTRAANETARVTAEGARATAETTRAANETARGTAEGLRVTAESTRVANETARGTAEGLRVTAETSRNTKETTRQSNETARVTAESTRAANETARGTAETARATAETTRAANETARVTAETSRVTAEGARVTAETTRASNETARGIAETARATAETTRAANETARGTAETGRVTAEGARVTAESTRAANETARVTAESTRAANETARQTAISNIIHKGAYSAATAYVVNNSISYNGSTYRCILATTGNIPTNTTYWALEAQRGSDGTGVGDMLKSVYDTTGNGIVDAAESVPWSGVTGKPSSTAANIDDAVTKSHVHNNQTTLDAITAAYTTSEATTLGNLNTGVFTTPNPTPVNLTNGLQVVTVPKGAPFNVLNIKGRTLINLLGRDGNCEDVSKWAQTASTIALDTTYKTYGSNALKVTIASGTTGSASTVQTLAVKAGKCYIFVVDIRSGTASTASISVTGVPTGSEVVSTAPSGTSWVRRNPSIDASIQVYLNVTGAVGNFAFFDGVRAYEITTAEYTAILGMTPAQIAAKYPYVDDVKHITAPYMIKYGENLLPPFTEWTLHANAVASAPYTLTVNPTATGQTSRTVVSVLSSTQYTITVPPTTSVDVSYISDIGTNAYKFTRSVAGGYTFTTDANTVQIQVSIYTTASTGNFTFDNPMLNLGTTALPFKPRNDDMLAFPNVQLASSVDGTVYDTLFKRDGKYFVEKRFKDVVLDGSISWVFGGDATGYKYVQTPSGYLTNYPSATNKLSAVKYDGKILNIGAMTSGYDYISDGVAAAPAISIADTDSGWGESYTPTADEIKAYFYGWRMYKAEDGSGATPYNGTGTKGWFKPGYGGGTTILPTASYSEYKTPYKLTYQLATPTFEEIQVEGGMSLHEGLNQIEVGQGVAIREKANPTFSTTYNQYFINLRDGFDGVIPAGNQLKNRLGKVICFYKNGKVDYTFRVAGNVGAYGNQYFYANKADYDLTATYEVSYIALDQYLLSAPVQAVTGEVASNLKTVVDVLATNDADQEARISAAEILARQIYNVPQKTTAAMTLYVDATNGADNNDGSAGKPFKTIQRAINSLPQIVNHTFTVNVAAGTYAEDVAIVGFVGSGVIKLIGAGAVLSDNFLISSVSIRYCTANVLVQGFKGTSASANVFGGSFSASITYDYCKTDVSATSAYAFRFDVCSSAVVSNCFASNRLALVDAEYNSKVYSVNNSGTGNVYGLASHSGSTIGKFGTQATATTLELADSGGTITGGVLNPWGDNTQSNRSYVKANRTTSAFSLTQNVWTKIILNAEISDNLSEYDPTLGEFTAKSAGTYSVGMSCAVNTASTFSEIAIGVYVNGVEVSRLDHQRTAAISGITPAGCTNVTLALGEKITIYAFVNGTGCTVQADAVAHGLTIVRIA